MGHIAVIECFGPSFCFENDTNGAYTRPLQIYFEESHTKIIHVAINAKHVLSAEAR